MFNKGLFRGTGMKLMSAFLTGIFMASSMLFGADGKVVISEIKKEIRDDGLSYGYQAGEDFDDMAYLKKLYGNSEDPMVKNILTMSDNFAKIFGEMGMNDIDGVGSSVARQGDHYDMDFFTHMKPGNENSVMWKVIGGDSAPLKTFDMLPENTVLAKTFRADLVSLWAFIQKIAPEINIPEAPDIDGQLKNFENMASQSGFPIEAVTKALSTEMSLFVTINEGKTMQLPEMPPLPQAGVSLIIEKKSDFIQNFLLQVTANAPTQKINLAGYNVVLINERLPTGNKAGFAYNDKHIILSSDIEILKKIAAAASGKNLVNSKKFAPYKSMARNGNAAFYVSSEISKTVSDVLKNVPPQIQVAASSYSVMFFKDKTPEMFGVFSKKKNGFKLDMLSTFNLPGASSSAIVGVAVVGVLAAMILPALGKARGKAKQAKSKSNLKNMGVSVAVFFADGVETNFPKDWKKFEMPQEVLVHPATGTEFTLEEFFAGEADYIPVYKVGDAYQGSSNKALFIERPGLWDDGLVHVVFEDAHVDSVRASTIKEVMEQLKKYKSRY